MRWRLLLAPAPAILLGVLIMRRHDVAAFIWVQNLAAGVVCTVVSAIALLVARRRFAPATWLAISGVAVLMLIATLFGDSVEGVRRWIAMGPLTLHAAAIALPVMLIALGSLKGSALGRFVPVVGLAALLVLARQPDAAQATAFGAALVVLLAERSARARTLFFIVATAALVVWSWLRPDPLHAVPHVEGMFALAQASGTAWLIASILAVALLPVPFLVARPAEPSSTRALLFALAVYFAVVCLAPLAGAFPVPLLGFGLSPVVGYFLALAWTVSLSFVQENR